MTIANLITRECVLILRSPTGLTDDYGNEQTLDDVTTDAVCEIQQRTPNERDDSGEVSDDEWRAFFLPGTDLTTASAVQVDGEVYEFVGEPWNVYHPLSKVTHHVEVKVRRTAGANDGGS